MQIRTAFVALLLVVAAGPALATGVVATDTPVTTDAQDTQYDCEYPIEVEDATGEQIRIEEEPETVVVTNANIAQHIWEMGAQEKVTGMPVAQYTAYLDGSENRTNVLETGGVNVLTEEVVDLDPDLVLAPDSTLEEDVERLRELGLTVYQYERVSDLDHMLEVTERTGQLIGECEAAADVTGETREEMEFVEEAVADEEPVDVYYDLFFPFTVGENTLENDVITRAGGNNVVNASGYPQVEAESIVEWNPEWLIIHEGAEVPEQEAFQSTTAVQEDQIIRVDQNLFNQHGPRNVEVLVQIAEALHPEAIEEARAAQDDDTDDGTTDDDADDSGMDGDDGADGATDDGMDGDDGSTDDADDDGAGLTVGAAAAALVALALIAVRRR